MDDETRKVMTQYANLMTRTSSKVVDYLDGKDNTASRLSFLIYLDFVCFIMEAITDILDEIEDD